MRLTVICRELVVEDGGSFWDMWRSRNFKLRPEQFEG